MEKQERVASEFDCIVCESLHPEPYSCGMCGDIVCKNCFKNKLKGKADSFPSCQEHIKHFAPNAFAKRLIGQITVTCENGCGKQYLVADTKSHVSCCPNRNVTCIECEKIFKLNAFEDHIFEQHADRAFQLFDEDHMKDERLLSVNKSDRVAERGNAHGDYASLGITGKYYCGQEIELCGCDGQKQCGVGGKGCNCRACMFLDVQARQLPPGFLVNNQGRACRTSKATSKVYCGAKVMPPGTWTDGYCGPTDGANCQPCQQIEAHLKSGYKGLNDAGVVQY